MRAAEPPADVTFDPATEKTNGEPADDFLAEFERLAQLDQEWRDHFAQSNIPMRASAEDEEKRQFMFDSLVAGTSLAEMLVDQLRESAMPEADRPVAELIIGNIDDYGYLKASVEEIAATATISSRPQSEPGGLATPSAQAAVKQINRLAEQGTPVARLRPCRVSGWISADHPRLGGAPVQ